MCPADEAPRPLAVVIEDDAEVAELLALVLTHTGFHPVVTSDGLAGVEAVRSHQPAIVTVDVALPGIDGYEVTRRIREFSTSYVVMVSALTGEDDILGGFAAGADDYVAKPFRPHELRSRFLAGLRRPSHRYAVARAHPEVTPPPAQQPPPTRLVELDGDWLVFRGLRLNPAEGLLTLDGVTVELGRLDFDLLELLLYAGATPRSAGDLALGLRGETYPAGSQVRESDTAAVVAAVERLQERLGAAGVRIDDLGAEGYRLSPS